MGWWCLSVVRSRRCETLFAAVPPTMVAICWTRRCQRAGSSCGQILRHSADRSTDGRRLIDVQTADSYIAALAVIVEARLCRVSFCSARPGDAYHFHTSLPCKQQDVEFRSLPTPPQLFKFKNVFLLQIFHCYPRSQHSLTSRNSYQWSKIQRLILEELENICVNLSFHSVVEYENSQYSNGVFIYTRL